MKETISRKDNAHKVMCRNSTLGNRNRYRRIENKVKKAVSKAMSENAKEALTYMKNCPNEMLTQLKGPMIDSKEVETGIYIS